MFSVSDVSAYETDLSPG